MNPIFIGLFIALIGGLLKLSQSLQRKKFEQSGQAAASKESAEAFAREAAQEDETVVLTDYSPQMDAYVVLTDNGLYYKQVRKSRNVLFSAKYDEIEKCSFYDFSMNKVKSDRDIYTVKIKSAKGACSLFSFPRMNQIAQELARHGFEKLSLFS